jgi:hypothetical protein
MMERKMKVRFKQMEADWKQRQLGLMQLEWSTCKQAAVVQKITQDAESMLTQLATTLTIVTYQIEEANTAIQEVDKATTVVADFIDSILSRNKKGC